MKKLLISALVLVIAFQVHAQNQEKKFLVKSGKIEMKLSGSTTGTKTIYFDDYGDKHYEHEKSVTEVKMFGITDRTEKDVINIMNKNQFWTIDNIENNNSKGKLPYYDASREMYANMTDAEQKKFADDILRGFGGEKMGTEKVLGKTCEKLKVMGSYVWIYKGIALKMETNVMGIIANEVAVKFDENASVSSSYFQEPKGLSFTKLPDVQSSFNQMESFDEEEESYDDIYPVDYPFADFQKVMSSFSPAGYIPTMMTQQDGQHMALYTQGFTNVVSVVATSDKNMEGSPGDDFENFESFRHGGKTLRYGDLADDEMGGKALIIPYKEHNMFIIIMSAPGKDKRSMLKMADELDF